KKTIKRKREKQEPSCCLRFTFHVLPEGIMATNLVGTGKMVGAQVRRVEDPRVLLGKSRYVDDIHLPGTVALTFVRSPYAHARITRIDVSAAQAHPGVYTVL